jgi:hypothetical protein
LRSPAISASIIARPETPSSREATEAGLDAGVLQHLGQPLALAGALLDQLLGVPGPGPQLGHRPGGDEASPQKPVLVQLGDPLAVGGSVLRPGTLRMCAALQTHTSIPAPASA